MKQKNQDYITKNIVSHNGLSDAQHTPSSNKIHYSSIQNAQNIAQNTVKKVSNNELLLKRPNYQHNKQKKEKLPNLQSGGFNNSKVSIPLSGKNYDKNSFRNIYTSEVNTPIQQKVLRPSNTDLKVNKFQTLEIDKAGKLKLNPSKNSLKPQGRASSFGMIHPQNTKNPADMHQQYEQFLVQKKKEMQKQLEKTQKLLEQEYISTLKNKNYKENNNTESTINTQNSQYKENQQAKKAYTMSFKPAAKNSLGQLRKITNNSSKKFKEINNNSGLDEDELEQHRDYENIEMGLERKLSQNIRVSQIEDKENFSNSQFFQKRSMTNTQIEIPVKPKNKDHNNKFQSKASLERIAKQEMELDSQKNKNLASKPEKEKKNQQKNVKYRMVAGKMVEVKAYPDILNIGKRYSSVMSKEKTGDFIENYQLGPTIGTGSYATVKLAVEKPSNQKYAIKIYEKFRLIDPQKRRNVQREISILNKLQHPNIIKLEKSIDNNKSISLVMEYVGTTSLHQFLKQQQGRQLQENLAKKVFKQLISAMSYMHSLNVIHRDIKMENILLDQDNDLKLIDFGFSITAAQGKQLSIFCGTPCYMSPEIVSKKDYFGQPVDIWACGILLFAMLTGTFPFRAKDDRQLFEKIKKGNYEIPPHVSRGASNLIEKILQVNPNKRITADQILNDTWLTPVNFQDKINQIKGSFS